MIEKQEIERAARVLCEADSLVPDAPLMLDGRPARLWEAYIDRAIADIERRSGLLRVLNPQRRIWLNEEDSQTLLPDVSRPYKRAIQLD